MLNYDKMYDEQTTYILRCIEVRIKYKLEDMHEVM